MAEHWTEADAESLDEKLQAFTATLTPAEQALLEARLAGADNDAQGYWTPPPPRHKTDPAPTGPAVPRQRPGSSATPPKR